MIGQEIYRLCNQLWKYDRSITGGGTRKTLQMIKRHLPGLNIMSIPSGEKVFDWKIPNEWKVNDAYIITPNGEKICEFSENNLHLVGYSVPFKGEMSLECLKQRLHSLPDQPTAIPYRTSYYEDYWGFCISQAQLDNLMEGTYQVIIDTELFSGCLNYAELILPGERSEEIFLSSYVCHPSLANNELSGPTVLTFLGKWLQELEQREYSYRLVFVPETIGSIAYLSRNIDVLKAKIVAGFNISCVGDDRAYSYIPSRSGNTLSDSIARHALRWVDNEYRAYSWFERGSDERQYCAPGVDLPIATICRTKFGEYPEYHTSLDDLHSVVTPTGLEGGYWALRKALEALEHNKTYSPKVLCEPQMGRRGLYPTLSTTNRDKHVKQIMDLLSMIDSKHSLLEIAELMDVPIWTLYKPIKTLLDHKLIH